MITRKSLTKGFTLLELMITLLIAGILAAIAVPAYNGYITRSRISEAVAQLADARMRMEQYFQDNRTYAGGPLPAANSTTRFNYAFQGTPNTSTFIIRATGTGSMTGFAYEIDQDNARTTIDLPANWIGKAANCWVINQGGGC